MRVRALTRDGTELLAELNQQSTGAFVTEHCWSAFGGAELEPKLRSLSVTGIALAGVSTSFGVEATARRAHDRGFNVSLALDAITDRDRDAHENSVSRICPASGEVGTSADVGHPLERR